MTCLFFFPSFYPLFLQNDMPDDGLTKALKPVATLFSQLRAEENSYRSETQRA
jgi:hypothetical protein